MQFSPADSLKFVIIDGDERLHLFVPRINVHNDWPVFDLVRRDGTMTGPSIFRSFEWSPRGKYVAGCSYASVNYNLFRLRFEVINLFP
jgi:hypothetical protein